MAALEGGRTAISLNRLLQGMSGCDTGRSVAAFQTHSLGRRVSCVQNVCHTTKTPPGIVPRGGVGRYLVEGAIAKRLMEWCTRWRKRFISA
jgi:hypothetical protein